MPLATRKFSTVFDRDCQWNELVHKIAIYAIDKK
jgi:hypothetical protein